MINTKEVLFSLADSQGVSGSEEKVSEKALSYLKWYTDNAYIRNGNVIGNIGEREYGKPHILIDSHIDQIGMICTYITDDGFIKVSNIGGLDRRLLLAQTVTVHGKKDITGVISTLPPHLTSGEAEKGVPQINDICIDTGYSKQELEGIVSLGDKISFANSCIELQGDRVSGKALDDRSGVTAILLMLDMLREKKLPCSLSVMFSTQEEVGERGAKIGAFEINPDIAIAVDVSFACTADENPEKCGKMGEGAMIGIAPSLDRELSKQLISIAEEKEIPYQIEVMNGTTGTNADQFSVNRCGAKASTVSIPLKYMHTPVEVISISDIEAVASLLAEYIMSEKNVTETNRP